MKVADSKCQFEVYSEKQGFKKCSKPAKHVHHIIGEAETLEKGEDPNENTGQPLCEDHHVRNTGDEVFSEDFAFHSDIASAYRGYKDWKQNQEHMNSITGRRTIDYSTSPFAEVAKEHHEKAKKGERYINGTEDVDQYYEEKMREQVVLYQAEHKDKPKIKPHPKLDRTKKKKWYDNTYD